MALPDNGPPPFDPTITKDALVQIYREFFTNHVKAAAFLFARKTKVNYSSRAFLAISRKWAMINANAFSPDKQFTKAAEYAESHSEIFGTITCPEWKNYEQDMPVP